MKTTKTKKFEFEKNYSWQKHSKQKKTFEFYIHRIIMRLFWLIKNLLILSLDYDVCVLTSSLSVQLFFPPKFLWNSFRDWQQKNHNNNNNFYSWTETKLKLKQTNQQQTKRNDWLII